MRKLFFVLSAPTGGGKTNFCSILPEEKFEIVSFDSRQVYKYLEWGTAKPNAQLLKKITHHLVDFLEPDKKIDARKYSELARSAILNIFSKNKIPILTCGTGFYLKAFLYGMYNVPDIPLEIKEKVESFSKEQKWINLLEIDPNVSEKLHMNDEYRVTRALEINLTGVKWSELKQIPEDGFLSSPNYQMDGIFIDWDRDQLYERINQRAKYMVENGMIEETNFIIEKFGKNCPALESLGYNFIIEYLEGNLTKLDLIDNLSQSHRNYAKKQITWFRGEKLLKRVTYGEAEKIVNNLIDS